MTRSSFDKEFVGKEFIDKELVGKELVDKKFVVKEFVDKTIKDDWMGVERGAARLVD